MDMLATIASSRRRYSAAARDYFARLDAVSGRVTAYDRANANLIDALVALGGAYWDTAGTITTLCAKGFDGLTVPLRDGMNVGTSYNFVSGDMNVKTGLKGDGTSKYIASGRNNNADGQNNKSIGVWLSALGDRAATEGLIGAGSTGDSHLLRASTSLFFRINYSTATAVATGDWSSGYIGAQRSSATEINWRNGGSTATASQGSTTPLDSETFVFRRGANYVAHRVSAYHIGPALTLATLDGILSTFMTEVNAV
jgi:hypothetical protein